MINSWPTTKSGSAQRSGGGLSLSGLEYKLRSDERLADDRKLGHDVTLLEFLRQCVLETIAAHGTDPSRPGTRALPLVGSAAANDARWDGTGNWPAKASSKYGRCRNCSEDWPSPT